MPKAMSLGGALAPGVAGATGAGDGRRRRAVPNADDRITNFTYDRNGRRLTEQRLGVAAYTVERQPARSPTGAFGVDDRLCL